MDYVITSCLGCATVFIMKWPTFITIVMDPVTNKEKQFDKNA